LFLTLWFGFSGDQALAAYSAWVWKYYHLPPYVGVFDHNFPGIFLINRVALALFGETILGFRIFDLLVQLLTLSTVYYVSLRFCGNKAAGFMSCLFYGIHYYSLGILDVFRPDVYAFCLLVIGIALALALKTRIYLRAMLVGIIAGFAFLVKPIYGLSWLVFLIWFLLEGKKSRVQKIWLEGLVFAAFCLLPSLAVVLYYREGGYTRELYAATLYYNSKIYTRFSPFTLFGAAKIIYSLLLDHPPILLFAVFGILFAALKMKEADKKRLFWVQLSLLLIGLFSSVVQNKNYTYHRAVFWGFALIFAGAGCVWIGERLGSGIRRVRGRVSAAIYYLAVFILALTSMDSFWLNFMFNHSFRDLKSSYLASAAVYPSNSLVDQYLAADYLQPMLRPGDEISYFGMWASIIHWQLKSKSPSRFIYAQHLLIRSWRGETLPLQEQFIAEYISSMINSRPRFFLIYEVLLKSDQRQFIDRHFSRLKTFIEQNYRLIHKTGNIDIYELASQLKADPGRIDAGK